MKIAFVTNTCPLYNVKSFETLAAYEDVTYYFFSAGDEWYWQQKQGVRSGEFTYEYLPGFNVGNTRISPFLVSKLLFGNYSVIIKCITGRFALPVTYLVARIKRKPFILWTGVWMTLQTRFHRLAFPLTRYIYRHADAVVVYGEHVKKYLIHVGVAPERIFVAHHAVDNALYNQHVSEQEMKTFKETMRIPLDAKVILFLGRLEEIKGVRYLIQAFSLLPHSGAVLVIAGDGSQKEELQALAQEYGVSERIYFDGYVPPERAIRYYAIADAFVLPSVQMPTGKELWGLVINEAMNQGVPVIATESVGAAAGGLVQDGFNGFVVAERDSEALARALSQILDDAALHQRLSENARSTIAAWDVERMVAGFRQAIAYVTNERS